MYDHSPHTEEGVTAFNRRSSNPDPALSLEASKVSVYPIAHGVTSAASKT